jgi:hypothetical protein
LPDAGSVEASVVKLAVNNAVDKPMYLPILSEAALDAILTDGRVQEDSFTYVVWAHYKSELMRSIAAERQSDEAIRQVAEAVTLVPAALSLTSWFAPTGPAVKLISAFLGIGLMAYQAYSVLHTLEMLNREIDLAMTELETENAVNVARFRELMSMPGQYLTNATETVMVEIGLIIAAKAFDELKQLLHWRYYYLDLETLIEGFGHVMSDVISE